MRGQYELGFFQGIFLQSQFTFWHSFLKKKNIRSHKSNKTFVISKGCRTIKYHLFFFSEQKIGLPSPLKFVYVLTSAKPEFTVIVKFIAPPPSNSNLPNPSKTFLKNKNFRFSRSGFRNQIHMLSQDFKTTPDLITFHSPPPSTNKHLS